MASSRGLTVEEYDEPVYYCRACRSICIVTDENMAVGAWDGSYCGKCGSTSIGCMKFGDWLAGDEARERAAHEREWRGERR